MVQKKGKATPVEGESDTAKNGQSSQRVRPTKRLPTDRIAAAKQLEILRAYATASGNGARVVTNADLERIVGLKATTITLANPFLADIGLIRSAEGGNGYFPSQMVQEFSRAFEWSPDTAAQKLSGAFSSTWFWQAIQGMVGFSARNEAQILAAIGEAASAGKEYKPQLGTLLEFLELVGLLERDGAMLKAARPGGAGQSATDERATPAPAPNPQVVRPVATSYIQPAEGAIRFNLSVSVSMQEMGSWPAERITAFFSGVAQALAARGEAEQESAE